MYHANNEEQKRQITEGIELSNQEKNVQTLRKGNFEVLRNVRSGHHLKSGEKKLKSILD